jgi:hypothetical protein
MNFARRRLNERAPRTFECLRVAAADHDAHAFFQKLSRRFETDAAACAGNDRRPALDAEVHVFSFGSRCTRLMSAPACG